MNYKKIISSQKTRMKILRVLDFISDKTMIKIQYRMATGRKIDLKNPKRFTEKIQYYKLNERNELLTKCVDKYEVRKYVESKKLEEILNPIYGVYDDVNQIKFEELPKKFVIKTTNGSHTNIFCENKKYFDISKTREDLNMFLKTRKSKLGREWAYYGVKPRVLVEKFIEKDKLGKLTDFKFICFNGKPKYVNVINEREKNNKAKLGTYDIDFNRLQLKRNDMDELGKEFEKPENFNEMIKIAEKLSEDFKHVRVDLYNVDGKILFGELTFYDCSGYQIFEPDEFDLILGNEFKIK